MSFKQYILESKITKGKYKVDGDAISVIKNMKNGKGSNEFLEVGDTINIFKVTKMDKPDMMITTPNGDTYVMRINNAQKYLKKM